jgi:hypothetical protein
MSSQAANVHGILSSAASVAAVEGNLYEADELVEDLEEALAILDVKLRHMRTDITVIEERNNILEHEAHNISKLLTSLDRAHRTSLCSDPCMLPMTHFVRGDCHILPYLAATSE